MEPWLRSYININKSNRTIDGWDKQMQHAGKEYSIFSKILATIKF